MVETLLRHNADPFVKDYLGMTPVHLILRSAELHVGIDYWRFKELFVSVENSADCVTDFGLSHLHVASYVNNAAAITKLLDPGADVKATMTYKPPIDGQNDSLSFLAPYDSYTPLHMAIHKHNELASETLVKRDADFLATEPGGAVLLQKILERNDCRRDTFVQIIKRDATVQKRICESCGLSMLHLACIDSDVDLAAELLNNGANPNALINSSFSKWSGYSPLHVVVNLSNSAFEVEYKMIELLLNHGADVTLANSAGSTAVQELFHDAYSEGCDYLELMLKYQKDYSVNPTNAKGVSHFHAACLSGNVAIVEEFLKHGVDVNLKIDYFPWGYGGYTPLHVAVCSNLGDTINLLLKYGADVNAGDRLGNTPLHTAARHSMNFRNLFGTLVSAGADVQTRTLLGSTVLQELTWVPSFSEDIELLVKHGCRVNSFNPLTQEGLIGLSLSDDTDDLSLNSFYEAIVEASDASDLDDMGRSPLHNIVSCHGFKTTTEAIGEFLEIGYNIDHQDEQGRTAIHCASSFCNDQGIIGLLEYGADINITDFNEQTAITQFLERKWRRTEWFKKCTENIVNAFVKHVNKLNFLKLHVNALNSNAYAKMIQKVNLEEQFSLECQNELDEMKKRTIDPLSISLFDFISSETRVIAAYPHIPLPQRQAIDAFFNTDQNVLRQNFSHLSCLLRLQYRKALARGNLIESAKYSLNTQIGFSIPDLCSNIIFGYLTNQDLKNLMSSTDE